MKIIADTKLNLSGLIPGPGKFQIEDVQPALSLCTHLIYGFAGITADKFEVVSLHPNLDTGAGYAYYRLATQLKKTFPLLKIYLSIGGNADPEEETHKYLVLVSGIERPFYYSVNRRRSRVANRTGVALCPADRDARGEVQVHQLRAEAP